MSESKSERTERVRKGVARRGGVRECVGLGSASSVCLSCEFGTSREREGVSEYVRECVNRGLGE